MASINKQPIPFQPLAVYEIDQVAKNLHVDDKTVRKLIKENQISAKKVGKAYKILGEDVLRFLGTPTIAVMKPTSHLEDLKS